MHFVLELTSGRFLGPNDEISAVMYSADLLALGELISADEADPQAGAFDKIVEINLNSGKTLVESAKSAYLSLVANVATLRGTIASTSVMREETYLFKTNAVEIMQKIGDQYGQMLIDRASRLIAKLETETQFSQSTNSREALAHYYTVAREVCHED